MPLGMVWDDDDGGKALVSRVHDQPLLLHGGDSEGLAEDAGEKAAIAQDRGQQEARVCCKSSFKLRLECKTSPRTMQIPDVSSMLCFWMSWSRSHDPEWPDRRRRNDPDATSHTTAVQVIGREQQYLVLVVKLCRHALVTTRSLRDVAGCTMAMAHRRRTHDFSNEVWQGKGKFQLACATRTSQDVAAGAAVPAATEKLRQKCNDRMCNAIGVRGYRKLRTEIDH